MYNKDEHPNATMFPPPVIPPHLGAFLLYFLTVGFIFSPFTTHHLFHFVLFFCIPLCLLQWHSHHFTQSLLIKPIDANICTSFNILQKSLKLSPSFPRMKNFPLPFSTTTDNLLITNNTDTTSSSSSNIINLAQQNVCQLQNANFPVDNHEQLGFSDPYYAMYDQNMQFQQVNQSSLFSFPTGQTNAIYEQPNYEVQGLSQQEGDESMKNMGSWTSKVARDKRKQVRQKSKSFVPMLPLEPTKGIKGGQLVPNGGSDEKNTINQDKSINDFCIPDGKKLEEILTKQLKNSDVTILGRIVLPKREAEAKLPPLTDKEGKDIILKDVYSEVSWTIKYKYWSNNRSRMYVLENTGEFVNHYGLQKGDFITIYVDGEKNLYVWARKKRNAEASMSSYDINNHCYMHSSTNEGAYLEIFSKGLNHKKEIEDANNGGGSSSSGRKLNMNMVQNEQLLNIDVKGTPSQETAEGRGIAAATPLHGHNVLISDEDVYEGLDNIFEIENNFHSFDYLKDYKM